MTALHKFPVRGWLLSFPNMQQFGGGGHKAEALPDDIKAKIRSLAAVR